MELTGTSKRKGLLKKEQSFTALLQCNGWCCQKGCFPLTPASAEGEHSLSPKTHGFPLHGAQTWRTRFQSTDLQIGRSLSLCPLRLSCFYCQDSCCSSFKNCINKNSAYQLEPQYGTGPSKKPTSWIRIQLNKLIAIVINVSVTTRFNKRRSSTGPAPPVSPCSTAK